MKYIFLDLDGVIISREYLCYYNAMRKKGKTVPEYDPAKVFLLNLLCDKIEDIRIVISSAHRIHHTLETMRNAFIEADFEHADKIVDFLPSRVGHQTRGFLIEEYVRGHFIDEYLILEDEPDSDMKNQPVIKTSTWTGGLTFRDTLTAMTAFSNPEEEYEA